MDALVMCGGRGTRLGIRREKPLVPVGGVPMVDRVLRALRESRVERTVAVTSPATTATAAHVSVPRVETPGEGYVPDLRRALAESRTSTPVLTVGADLPLIDGDLVDHVVDGAGAESRTLAVPAWYKRALGLSVDSTFRHGGRHLAPAGVNVVGGDPEVVAVRTGVGLAVNVNRPGDLAVARRFVDRRPPRKG